MIIFISIDVKNNDDSDNDDGLIADDVGTTLIDCDLLSLHSDRDGNGGGIDGTGGGGGGSLVMIVL